MGVLSLIFLIPMFVLTKTRINNIILYYSVDLSNMAPDWSFEGTHVSSHII